MSTVQKEELRLSNMLEGINFVLELYSDDQRLLLRFMQTCYRELGGDINWFHQSSTESYQLFEFWSNADKFPIIYRQSKIVADYLSMPLKVEIEASAPLINPNAEQIKQLFQS